nr:retrovirus-related Pol polyprotein from transposon TNT 1-94 [Tanacetum cinerariifolium]
MANLSEDIQCAGSDTRPPMLDRTDFASWKQRIRLYRRGKDNGLNSKFMNNMLPEWGRFVTVVKLNRGLRDSNYDQLFAYLKKHEAHAKENKMMLERLSQPTAQPTTDHLAFLSNASNTQHGYGEAQNRVGNVNQGQARPGQARTDLALNVDNVFQSEDCDAFDSDVDEAPTTQTMFMANLSSADPITDEARPSYYSDILLEVQDHD